MKRRRFHPTSLPLLVAILACTSLGASQNSSSTSAFTIFSRGQVIGAESVTVTRSADGETIASTGGLGAPFDISTTRFLLRYNAAGTPVSVAIEGTENNQRTLLSATFADGTARVDGMLRGQPIDVAHQISPRSIVIAPDRYATYEVLAERLASASIGNRLRVYVLGVGEVDATVDAIVPHRLITPSGPVDLRQFDLTLAGRTPLPIEVWIDARGRLARFAVPSSWLVVIREDISSVMTREERIARPGDQEVFIPALGFQLAATLSKPTTAQSTRPPAVVLVGAPGVLDRDELTSGIPVFGQLAGALADRGLVVLRYDQRGVGRSGGRPESATLADYADDALAVVKWMRNRQDLDRDRVVIAGYGQGAAVGLLAASREKKIAALALVGAAGQTGREVTLQQQQHLLSRSTETDAIRRAKIDLQLRLLDAVISGKGWETLPPELRSQADSVSFKSWLLFDPGKIIPRTTQPLLILTGALDTEFPPAQADRLEALAQARKKVPASATSKVIVPGVNHLLVPAPTGEQDEYASLAGASVAPAVSASLADWISRVLASVK